MHILEDTICKFCDGIFCCSQCRRKHEIKNHAIIVRKPIKMAPSSVSSIAITTCANSNNIIAVTGPIEHVSGIHNEDKVVADRASFETIYLFCPVCAKQPLPLQEEIHREMLIHIEAHHLPLRCQKCAKMYNTIDDLKEFTKCMKPNTLCLSQETVATNQTCCSDDTSKLTVTKALSTVHSSPMRRQEFNESHLTPISIINMRWKAKSNKVSNEEFISDSVSSIKNISSISNSSSIRQSIGGAASSAKGKVIRSTSTPVHLEMVFARPKEQTLNGTGHISSIQYNSGCESETSPAIPYLSSQALEPLNRYRKASGARPKMTAVTPLRHVMSKSIQKAFVEHGLPAASTGIRGGSVAFQRKKMFDSTTSPSFDCGNSGQDSNQLSPEASALDLRLSPAVRRSQSESEDVLKLQNKHQQQSNRNEMPKIQRNILLSAQKLTTESIVITRTAHLSSSVQSSSSTSAISSHGGSTNTLKPHTSTNSSYQSATSNSTGNSVFKSCRSVEIITATTEEIQEVESIESLPLPSNNFSPNTPITRIPGALINKKVINFETPKVECCDNRELNNSTADVFFTPNSTSLETSCLDEEDDSELKSSAKEHDRKMLVKQNLSGRFLQLHRPSLKDCHKSSAFNRIENITEDSNETQEYNDELDDAAFRDDDVFVSEEKEKIQKNKTKSNDTQNAGGLWSIMSSVIRMPTRQKSSLSKNESPLSGDPHSKSLVKRCASIAGSLVRSKPLMDENDLKTFKRKRTYTLNEQSSSAYLNLLNNSDTTSPNSDSLNTSSKRFRIQGRRPIDRMRLNS